MGANEEISQRLDEIAKMIDVLGEDSFRALANSKAARIIGSLPTDVRELAKDRKALLAIDGVGPKIADKIIEFCETGTMKEHDELRRRVPSGVLALTELSGLGPKTAHVMWKQGHIDSIAKLEKAIADGSILELPRMGEKAVEKIKQSLALAKSAGERLWLGRAQWVADIFLERLSRAPDVAKCSVAGSLRRGKETIGDIDILVALKHHAGSSRAKVGPIDPAAAERVGDLFRTTPGVTQVLVAGETKSSVRFALSHEFGRWKLEGREGEASAGPSIQVDLRVLPIESWGSGLMYFTGSKEHNIRLRSRALDLGYTLNEWGLFPLESPRGKGKSKDAEVEPDAPPQQRGVKPIASETEEDIYRALGLPWVPPEVREDRGEIDVKETPDLIELADIRSELHAHTKASDGSMTIEELAQRAKERGFHTIAVTDHSRSSIQANGLSVERLLEHVQNVHRAREKVKGIHILAGSEVDIHADGTLDYDDKILAKLDIVVASPHAALSQSTDVCTERLLRAVRHPRVHILGHPTGRLINRRKGLEPDMAKLIAAAKQHNVALEINAHWLRLDLRDTHVRAAVDAGCLIAIDCDVHEPEDFENLRFGVMTARRGWCTRPLCINTWPLSKLTTWLESKRA